MWFFVAGSALVLALLASLVLDDAGVREGKDARHDVRPFDAW
jgi:hypothetical protein